MLGGKADIIVANEANRMSSNQSLLQNSVQLSVLYQLEQRKVQKLEKENLALLERNRLLLTNKDDARIEQLAHDRTKQKLIHLRTLTKKTIVSLQSGLKEFNAFCNLVDDAIEEEDRQGAIAYEPPINPRISALHAPLLGRIPETGMSDNTENCSTTPNAIEVMERGAESVNKTYVVDTSPKPIPRVYSSQLAEAESSAFKEVQFTAERTCLPQKVNSQKKWTLTPDPRKHTASIREDNGESNLASLRKSKPLYTSTPKMGLRGKMMDCQPGVDLSVINSLTTKAHVETSKQIEAESETPNVKALPPKTAKNARMSRALNRKKKESSVVDGDSEEEMVIVPPKRRRSRIPMLSTNNKSLKSKRRPSDSSPERAPPPHKSNETSSGIQNNGVNKKSSENGLHNDNAEHQLAPQESNINNRPRRAAARRVTNYIEMSITKEVKAPRRKKASKA